MTCEPPTLSNMLANRSQVPDIYGLLVLSRKGCRFHLIQMDRARPSSIVSIAASRVAIAAVSLSRSIREVLVHLKSHLGGLFRGHPIFEEFHWPLMYNDIERAMILF